MNLYKRHQTWWVEWVKDGKRHRQSTGTHDRRKAEKFLASIQLATKAPTFEKAVEFLRLWYGEDEKNRIPLGSAWDRYAEVASAVGKDAVAEKTWRMRRERLARFVRWCDEHRPNVETVEAVSGRVAADYAAHLKESGLKGKTRQNIIGELTTVWKLLAKASSELANPWDGLAPRDSDSVRLEAFSDEQVERVLDAARRVGKGWHLACLVALDTGLRYGDVANLKWSEVDLEKSVIRLAPQKTRKHGIGVAVPMTERLRVEIALARETADFAHPGSLSAEYVLPNHAALYGDRGKNARKLLNFAEVLTAAGISGNFTFHSFRHTFRTRLAEAGVSDEVAMMLCGHTTKEMSARYDHSDRIAELVSAISALERRRRSA